MDLSRNILYEDEHILAINKPAELVVHPDGRTDGPSVSEWFVGKYPEARSVGEPIKLQATSSKLEATIERPGIVHRIDKDTSGVLLLAKTKEGHKCLKEQFQNREVEKTYQAFVYGIVKQDHGTINKPIGRSKKDFRKWSAQRDSRGEKREATTYFEVLKRSPDKEWTFVEAKPKTGRTHQIRVHMKSIHHPVVCDTLYAPKKPSVLGFNRLALHARSISFKNVAGESVSLEAPYPEDFKRAIDIIR